MVTSLEVNSAIYSPPNHLSRQIKNSKKCLTAPVVALQLLHKQQKRRKKMDQEQIKADIYQLVEELGYDQDDSHQEHMVRAAQRLATTPNIIWEATGPDGCESDDDLVALKIARAILNHDTLELMSIMRRQFCSYIRATVEMEIQS